MAEELTVGKDDRISVIISGVKGSGGGRATRQVDYDGNLQAFLDQYGEKKADVAEPDWDSLKGMGKTDAAGLQAAMAKITSDLLGSGAKPLPQQVVDAVCKFLVDDQDMIIADADPGTDKFYVSKGDLTPQIIPIPGDGKQWLIAAAAPFG